ncbi:hypothetical protein ACMD2_24306 [Ananas comosus]|uniref:DUF7804 domain-containing protein n=1 Tax=Ananas comosus TaxID=4615 RepID=A0A199V8F8_ANACO|nr:hypothetical protein ACMD2_24306 [Ananas comosus]
MALMKLHATCPPLMGGGDQRGDHVTSSSSSSSISPLSLRFCRNRSHRSIPPLRLRPMRRIEAALSTATATKTTTSQSSASLLGPIAPRCVDRVEEEKREPVSNEDLDMWMRDSIQEIVRNIGEAPFLVHIFSGGRGGSGRKGGVRLEKEKASPDSWPQITRRWDREGGTPDGVILVEAIEEEEEDEERGPLLPPPTPPCAAAGPNSACKTWGLVVQGRGMDCAACYVLNTCRVRSSVGFCTHFSLVRAKCFGEAIESQIRNAWLQGN